MESCRALPAAALIKQCQENFILQVQQQRITELTVELQESNNKVHDSRALKGAADQRITEMTHELENNAGATFELLHVHASVVIHKS